LGARGKEDLARIEYSCDLHASDAVYHQVCSVNFRMGRDKPDGEYGTKKRRTSCGRSSNASHEEAFLKVIIFLQENDEEQNTLQTLVDKMNEYLDGNDSFTTKYMRVRLMDYFGDEIMITTTRHEGNVVTFREKASNILQDFYSLPKYDDLEREKPKINRGCLKTDKE